MADLDNVISKIKRVRASGEKPKLQTFLGMPLQQYSCEICGKTAQYGINQCPYCGRWVGVTGWLSNHKACWSDLYGSCKICGDFIVGQLGEKRDVLSHEEILDPYLISIKEKFTEVEEYFKGKRVYWGPVVLLLNEAIMITLQRLIIEKRGIKPIEQLKKEKKLYFDVLVRIISKGGVEITHLKDLELLKDLRNKIEHEDYKPSKKEVLWAFKTAKRFISQFYPEIFQ
jgi:hypothetical protein